MASKCGEGWASGGTWITEGISLAAGGCATAEVAQRVAQKNITQENIAANPGRGGIWFVLLEHLLAEVYTE
jgi:hypothetical protein